MRVLLVLLLLGCVEKEIITPPLEKNMYCLYKRAPVSTNGQTAGTKIPSTLVDCFEDPFYRPPSGYEGYLNQDCNCKQSY
jgi:hypothetical protein